MTAVMPAGVETARDLVGPALAAAVERLSPDVRRVAAYHLGLAGPEGAPSGAAAAGPAAGGTRADGMAGADGGARADGMARAGDRAGADDGARAGSRADGAAHPGATG